MAASRGSVTWKGPMHQSPRPWTRPSGRCVLRGWGMGLGGPGLGQAQWALCPAGVGDGARRLRVGCSRVPVTGKGARTCCCILGGPGRGRWLRSSGPGCPSARTSPGWGRGGGGQWPHGQDEAPAAPALWGARRAPTGGPRRELPRPPRGPPRTHLEPAEPDHAVHHLCDAEAVPEVVEGVVPVVVVHAELRGRGRH